MSRQEISVDKLKEILEVSQGLKVRDHTPRNLSERTAKILANKDEEVPPEVLLRKKMDLELEELSLQDIKQHIDRKYGSIADPEITNVNAHSASLGYDPEDDHSVKADYRMQLHWGYEVEAFGRKAGKTNVGKIDIRAEEQPEAVVEAVKDNLELDALDDYRISGLVHKLPRRKKYHPKKLHPSNIKKKLP